MFLFQLDDKKPVNVNCQDDLGNTALHCSAFRSQKQVAIFLLEHGIEPSVRNIAGMQFFIIPGLDFASYTMLTSVLETNFCSQPFLLIDNHIKQTPV